MTDRLEASRTKGKRLEDIEEYFRRKIGGASPAPTP
jgi:hypothetical protein